MSFNNAQSASGNLINLGEKKSLVPELVEFDPLSSSATDNVSTMSTAPVVKPRRPARPPPPPPLAPKSPRSKTVSGTSSDSVLLNFSNGSSPVRTRPQQPFHASVNKVQTSNSVYKNKSSSFYIPTDKEMEMSDTLSQRSFDSKSASTPDVTQVGNSTFNKFQDFEGASGHNEMTSKFLGQREEIMQLFMAKRQDDYTSRKTFSLFVGTWNVNGQLPTQALDPWLASDEEPPDMYIVGFQELDLSKEAFVFAESSREDEWLQSVKRSLHPKSKYQLVRLQRLVGMMILFFAQARHLPHISGVVSHQVGTGLLGKMGNKGGVGIRFKVHGSTICAVNSHLAAHSEEVQRRNQDYSDICSRMRFQDPQADNVLDVFHHDILIWLGDLNYRIDRMVPELVKELIEEKHFKPLKENDQLYYQKREGLVFHNFEEGEINFRPTYKYNPGTDHWDSSEKFRTPAWCDRILWRELALVQNNRANPKKKPVKAMKQLQYRSHPAMKISDHKPVSALFDVAVKIVDQERYRKVYEEEIRRLDRLENDWLPTMTLNKHNLDFGVIKFQRPSMQLLELHNTGQTPCHFEFIGKLGESNFCKPWLTVSKPKGYVLPDEKVDLEFEVYVNKGTAPALNKGEETIEDILILHLIGGKDFFITLNGKYSPSCFGTSIEALCRMNKPIEQIPQADIARLSKISAVGANQLDTTDTALQVPKELWWILDHLYHHAKEQPDLFQQPGLHHEFQEIQEILDSNLPTSNITLPGSNHSVAEALLVFLEALPEPVIPFDYYTPCLDVADNLEMATGLLRTMSPRHRHVFNYLLSFLQELPKYTKTNHLDIHMIATIFSGLILRPGSTHRKGGFEARLERQKATMFIESYLRSDIKD